MRLPVSISGCLGRLLLAAWISGSALAAGDSREPRLTPINGIRQGTNAGFDLLSPLSTGILFTNVLSDSRAGENQIRMNGSGVALGDVDGDGRCDVVLAGLETPVVLYRNLGEWKFADVTASSGLAVSQGFHSGVVLSDVDGDGDLDLLVAGIGLGVELWMNDGSGHFLPAKDSGLDSRSGAMSMALADVDGDSDLDLYVANYRAQTIRSTGFVVLQSKGRKMIRPEDRGHLEYTDQGRVIEHGEPDVLYLNDGSGRFTALPWTDGRFLDERGRKLQSVPRDWSLTARFHDMNGDGVPDLYVCSDFHSEDRIWINQGDGVFRALPAQSIGHLPTFSMSVDFADVNKDGQDDFMVVDMLGRRTSTRLMQRAIADPWPYVPGLVDRAQYGQNTLQIARGDGTYADIAAYAGVAATDWTWSVGFVDVDLDGWDDLIGTTGNLFDTQDQDAEARIQASGPWPRDRLPQKLLMYPRLKQPKFAFRNAGNLRFQPASSEWGFNHTGVAHGMAFGDLDGDGDLDIVVNNLNEAAGVYRNRAARPRILVRLIGALHNRSGIGARIRLLGGPAPQKLEMFAGGRYLSGDEAVRMFACGTAARVDVEVTWRSGQRQTISNVPPNSKLLVWEPPSAGSGTHSSPPSPESHPKESFFSDVSSWINWRDAAVEPAGFSRQPLLPTSPASHGSGLSWIDVNSDGWPDLVLPGGPGQGMTVFVNQRGESFTNAIVPQPWMAGARRQAAVIGWSSASNMPPRLFVTEDSGEEDRPPGPLARVLRADGDVLATLPGHRHRVGSQAAADLDGDGGLEWLACGRSVPGRWPEPATSLVFRQEDGKWTLDGRNTAALVDAGMIHAAVFTDLDGDGDPDLAAASEWGPLRIWRNDSGVLRDSTKDWAMDGLPGIWLCVGAGDFDGDGAMDLVGGNWGTNDRRYSAGNSGSRAALWYGDIRGGGGVDVFEAVWDHDVKDWVPERAWTTLFEFVPTLREAFASHASFGTASMPRIIEATKATTKSIQATWFESTVFLNRGNRFVPIPLPPAAQWAPVHGIAVTDFDGDGIEDLFLAQNSFGVEPTQVRQDAGRGLVLLGIGDGKFEELSVLNSGISIPGDGRGVAVADFDRDGRMDVAATQLGGTPRLFRNRRGKPGVAVRMMGHQGQTAVGASLRLVRNNRPGPRRELRLGGGHASQDDPTFVLPELTADSRLEVRWPGGRQMLYAPKIGSQDFIIQNDMK